MGAILVMYHYVRDPDGDGLASCSVADFEGHVEQTNGGAVGEESDFY